MKIQVPQIIIIILLAVCITLLGKAMIGGGNNVQAAQGKVISSNQPSTIDIIMRRKSVRDYLDKPIDKDTLMTILKAGMAAPSAANKQPWSFITITDRKTLDTLAGGLPNAKMLGKVTQQSLSCGSPSLSLPGENSAYWVQDCTPLRKTFFSPWNLSTSGQYGREYFPARTA